MNHKKALTLTYLLGGLASAETTQFRIGTLLDMLFNVLGFNVLDFTTAIPDYLVLLFIIGLFVAVVYLLKWKKRRF